ncbi:hypothetical protein [Lutibacter oceani]|uniref:hypothetical protein n=1 Tax=Lutibacter oceani TaxID=1853311 RepID=UPI0021CF089E|nr:hypothetical protein [Lutibacter oceani]
MEIPFWDRIALKYQEGVNDVETMVKTWNNMKNYVVEQRYNEVKILLYIQYKEAKRWRDTCFIFNNFLKKNYQKGVKMPTQTLEYFKSSKFPFAPEN